MQCGVILGAIIILLSIISSTVSYRTNYRLNILSSNYRHIVYEMIIGKFQLIVANVT